MEPEGCEIIYRQQLDAIFASDAPGIEKLARAFGGLTDFILKNADRQIELARAAGDREEIVKQQIKMETLRHARGIFGLCYQGATGKAAWDDQPER